MTAVVLEVIARVFAVSAAGTAVPSVRTAVSAASATLPGAAGAARATTAQTGQGLGDGFGGIRLCRLVRFGGHRSILHAT